MAAILGDAKATVRAGALTCLTAMADAAGLDPLLPNLAASLELPKPDLRRELLLWLDGRFADPATLASLDLTPLAAPLLACLEDRNPEVRKAAQAVLPNVVAGAGYSFLMDQTSGLKPASRSTVIPFIEAARSAAAASAPAPAPAAKAPPRGLAGPAAKVAKAASTATSSSTSRAATPTLPAEDLLPKPRPPALSSLKRSNGPGATSRSVSASAPPPPPVPSSSSDFPLRTTDSKAKQIRAAKDAGPGKWILEGVARPDQVEQLYQQMGPHVSGELLGLLFSKDHHAERDYLHGLALLDDLVANPSSADLPADEVRQRVIANLDLVLKYMSIRLADHNSSLISKCLDLIEHLVTLLSDSAFRLSDYEASCFLPTLISKVRL
jgi:cytoskeleton-associated protein 5